MHLLHINDNVKKTFTPGPTVSFRGTRKLSSYLYPLQRPVGPFKCNGKRYQVWMNVTESNTFSSSVGKKEYVINHSFNCYEKCIIYLLTYNKCKMKYVGKTFDAFRLRWNSYKVNNRKYLRKKARMQQHLFEHFSSEVTVVFWMTSPLSLLIKLILKILTNGYNTGNIPLKQWHLKVWMWRIIDSCSFVLLIYPILFKAMTACIRAINSNIDLSV